MNNFRGTFVINFRSYLFCGILCLLIGTCYHEFTWCFQNSLNDKEVDIFHDLFKYLAECRRYKNFSIPSLGSIQSLQAMRNIGETRIRRESPLLILLSWIFTIFALRIPQCTLLFRRLGKCKWQFELNESYSMKISSVFLRM